MNKTFISMLEALGYDIEITYVKKMKNRMLCVREDSHL